MIRKLDRSEHHLTRKLWEEIFVEDSKKYIDYYYSNKTLTNDIYVAEENGEIVAMLHLNPYIMRIYDKEYQTHYIVGVATKPEYRRRGFMRMLIERALHDMKLNGEPFTFLMPAKEEYYTPFGFFTVQNGYMKTTFGNCDQVYLANDFRDYNYNEMSHLANQLLLNYDVTVIRDESYFRSLRKEFQSEGGDIRLYKDGTRIVGMQYYTEDDLDNYKMKFMVKVLQPEFENLFENAKVFLNEVV